MQRTAMDGAGLRGGDKEAQAVGIDAAVHKGKVVAARPALSHVAQARNRLHRRGYQADCGDLATTPKER